MKTIEQLTENYKIARSITKDMTVGERYSNAGQTLLDNEFDALDELSAKLGATHYEVVSAFNRNQF